MRHDPASLIRAAKGAVTATLLLLALLCVPALATATDCDATRPAHRDADRLAAALVDLAADSIDGAPVTGIPSRRDETDGATVTPDLSSRSRTRAILREIFGEPVDESGLDDYSLAPAHTLAQPAAPGLDELADVERPAAGGLPDGDYAVPGGPADTANPLQDGAARLPGVDTEDMQDFRRQMFRTDI